jgi:hypothetical protein
VAAIRLLTAIALTVVVQPALAVPAQAARTVHVSAAQDGGGRCATGARSFDEQPPWPQRLLAPTEVWPLTRGAGVRVGIVGTGVDARHPQFGAGRVGTGSDVLAVPSSARRDCDGRGTFAAGIIAARPAAATTFAGIAPEATIVPIRATGSPEQAADPDALARAIDAAVSAGAEVICVVTPAVFGSDTLTRAVERASAADAVVVAPVAVPGQAPQTPDGSAAGPRGPASFPAADGRVLAVGAIDATGAATTPAVDRVDVAAPGRALVGPAPGAADRAGHIWPVDDDAMAAAYAAGVVVLVRAYRPELTARQVIDRVTRTADRAAGAGRDARLGWGVVDLAAAVTAEGVEKPRGEPGPGGDVRLATAGRDSGAGQLPAGAALLGLALAVLIAVGTGVVRRGRTRGWRADNLPGGPQRTVDGDASDLRHP